MEEKKRPKASKKPFIRIIGEVSGGRQFKIGDQVRYHLSYQPIVPKGQKVGYKVRGEIRKESDKVIKTKPVSDIVFDSEEEDLTRYDNQSAQIKVSYNKLFEIEDLKPGDYTASIEMLDRNGKVIATDELKFVVGKSKAVLHKRIPLQRKGGSVRVGDLTGDGKIDFLYTYGTQHQTAYSNSGEILWQYNNPDGAVVYNSAAVRVYDVDGDGRCEVVCMRGKFGNASICIIEGSTGRIQKEIEWPHINALVPPDKDSPDIYKKLQDIGHAIRSNMGEVYGAKVVIANFTGKDKPQDILLQTGEQNKVIMTALNSDLDILWDKKIENGRAGHTCWVEDIDGDGKDEVAVGTEVLDHDGTLLWEKPFEAFAAPWEDDHIDGMRIDDIDGDGEMEIAYTTRTAIRARTGEILWQYPTLHGQDVFIIDSRDDIAGKQVVIQDRHYRVFGHLIYGAEINVSDCRGNQLWSRKYMSMHMPRILDWTGDGKKEIISSFELPRQPIEVNAGIFDGYGRLIGVLPRCGNGCDVTGNLKEDLVSWALWPRAYDTLEIYTNTIKTEHGRYSSGIIDKDIYNEPD